ncbi:MAG TPA: hypothetical protein VJV79_06335 [Polyangiaceae bacterium]|nr:hypothetical protein [Polyangiaceae bacterium]
MKHSIRLDSFCVEDELFFRSYEAEPVDARGSQPLEFDALEAQPPTAEQLAHFTRFRRPVAWVVAAMGSLSLLALGLQGSQQNSRSVAVAHMGSATAVLDSSAAKHLATVSALPGRSAFASAAERPSEAAWSWTELAESALALVLEPTPPSISGGKQSSQAEPATQATLVNDFTSSLLSMCRNAPA